MCINIQCSYLHFCIKFSNKNEHKALSWISTHILPRGELWRCVLVGIFKLIAHHTRATAHYSWFWVFLSNVLRKISEKMMVKNLCVDNNSHLLTFFPSWTNIGLFPSWTNTGFVSSQTAQSKEHVKTWCVHFEQVSLRYFLLGRFVPTNYGDLLV